MLRLKRKRLDELYCLYNRREYVRPDPVEFLYDYPDLRDRELVGLIASSLAYGRVNQILKSVSSVLKRMNHSPFSFLRESSRNRIYSTFSDFQHRFTTGDEMARMLWGSKHVIERYGSLYACFLNGLSDDEATILPALSAFVREIKAVSPARRNSALASPRRGSACKRLNLFLRWMVRQDDVDPGGWSNVPVSKLIVPLDTHMYRICFLLNCTRRKQADMHTAIQITDSFRTIAPEDPVRYDFALTRLGIRSDTDLDAFLEGCRPDRNLETS
jgi:uncharacterized protein (TIGR02757 family)